MKTKFLIGLSSAVITFGSLFTILGPPHCVNHINSCSVEQKCHNESMQKKLNETENNSPNSVH